MPPSARIFWKRPSLARFSDMLRLSHASSASRTVGILRPDVGGSSNGRTLDFDSKNLGSNPSPPAKVIELPSGYNRRMKPRYDYVLLGGGTSCGYAARGIRELDSEGSIGI